MEMESPIGKNLRLWDMQGKIIGVVKDYHNESLHREIMPTAMRIIPGWNDVMCIRIGAGNMQESIGSIENLWKEYYPDYPFTYRFLDDSISKLYDTEEQTGRLSKYFTVLAVVISCLGLFGLASFTAEQRTKEIGIRKVLGASGAGLVLMLSKEITKWVIISNIIAWPIAYYLIQRWLEFYAYRIDISIWVFALSGILVVTISLLTISIQTVRAASSNPVDSLRYE